MLLQRGVYGGGSTEDPVAPSPAPEHFHEKMLYGGSTERVYGGTFPKAVPERPPRGNSKLALFYGGGLRRIYIYIYIAFGVLSGGSTERSTECIYSVS